MKLHTLQIGRSWRFRRHSHWALMLSSALAASSVATVAAAPREAQGQTAPADERVLAFNIAAGPLDRALDQFRQVTGANVVLGDPNISGIQSPGVTGSMTAAQAMEALLAGTSLKSSVGTDGFRLDVRGVSEFVAVTGQTRAQSPKYTQPLLNTPATVSVIPREVFQQQSATTLREVLRNTPGVTMSIGEGGSSGTSSGDNVLIRGFMARNDIYIDGARNFGATTRDSFNVESVEIAKGPTSVTGGRGATGGSINLVTKAAGLGNFTDVRFTGGNQDHARTTIDTNRTINEHTALRLNAVWQDTGYPGRDVARYRSWGFAPSLTLGLGTPTQVAVNYSRVEQDNIPDLGLPTLLPDTAIAQGVTVNDLDFSNFYGLASRDYERTTSDILTATVQHKFNQRFTLRNLTRYGKEFRDAVITPPRPVTTVAGQGSDDPGYNILVPQIRRTDTKYQNRNDRIISNQTDLSADVKTGMFLHSLDFGIELSQEHQPSLLFADTFANGRPPVSDLFNPTPNATYNAALAPTGATTEGNARSKGFYAFDNVKIGRYFHADFGLRWDSVDVDYTTVSTAGVRADFARAESAVSGRGAMVFKPVDRGSIYGAYSTSFQPVFDATLGLQLGAVGVNSQALAPEESHNIEFGTKWMVRNNLELTGAFFIMEKTNARTTDLNGATVLAGDQKVTGAEFGLKGNITPDWSVFTGLSLMDGEVVGSGDVTEVGQELAYVPNASLNLWTTYRLKRNIIVGGGANYESGHFFNNTGGFLFVSRVNDPRYVQNAAAIQALTEYWTANAMVIIPVTKHLQLQINGSNLGNTRYADRAYDRHFLPGPTRQILFTPVITW